MPRRGAHSQKRRIVVLSDIHLGDSRSTLQGREVVDELIHELNQGKKIDELILLGDILDLAFSPFRLVIDRSRKFFNRIRGLDIGKIVYIHGNHDFHIWLLHIEKRDIIEPIRKEGLPELPDYISLFSGKKSFFSEVLPQNLEKKVVVRFPNYEFETGGIRYLLHHGHQVYGPCVLLMSPGEALHEGKGLGDLLIANSPIIELIYYHLERSEEMRKRLEDAWKKYGSQGAIAVVIKELLDARLPKLGRMIVHIIIKLWLWYTKKRIKKDRGTEIDEIENEIRDYLTLCGRDAHNPLRFIFGHSHVPGGKKIGNNLTIVNCGSWLKEDSRHNTYVLIEGNTLALRKLGEKDPLFTTLL
jgi:predicted phosphodiesterase